MDAPPEFWSLLGLAAAEMQVLEANEIHGEAIRIVNRHAG